MSELKPGDKVRIKSLEEILAGSHTLGWVNRVMDEYAGKELTVIQTSDAGPEMGVYFSVEECGWVFSVKWIDTTPQPITVPVDPSCVPAGYRAVRVGVPKKGECAVLSNGTSVDQWDADQQTKTPRIIVEKIPDPIVLPDWIPAGWWIAKDESDDVHVYTCKPLIGRCTWKMSGGEMMYLRDEGLLGTIPQSYLDLPWKESLMQKEVKG